MKPIQMIYKGNETSKEIYKIVLNNLSEMTSASLDNTTSQERYLLKLDLLSALAQIESADFKEKYKKINRHDNVTPIEKKKEGWTILNGERVSVFA